MAKNKRGSGAGRAEGMSTRQNVKNADIYTAAKSSMEPCDYSEGYPANEGELLNANFAGRSKKPGGRA